MSRGTLLRLNLLQTDVHLKAQHVPEAPQQALFNEAITEELSRD